MFYDKLIMGLGSHQRVWTTCPGSLRSTDHTFYVVTVASPQHTD